MEAGELITILGAVGAGTVVPELARGIINHFDGRFDRERILNADALTQEDRAWARVASVEEHCEERERQAELRVDRANALADAQSARASRLREYASVLRALLLEKCAVTPDEIPPWPEGAAVFMDAPPPND